MLTEQNHFVMVDLETGGLYENQHCILQVGAIIFHVEADGKLFKLVEDAQYQSKVIPNKNLGITLGALEINGLNIEDLIENGKEEKVVYREIMDFIEQYMGKEHDYNGRIWAHNEGFDAKFMSQLAKRCKGSTEKNIFYETNWNCTQHQYRFLRFLGRHTENSCKLSNVMAYYGLEQEGTEHDALSDAHNAIRVLECIMNHLKLGTKVVALTASSQE